MLPTPKGAKKKKRYCLQQGCSKKAKNSYCEEHEKKQFKNKVGSTHVWYQNKIWRGNPNKKLGKRGGLREAQLMRQPLCAACEDNGEITTATVVDHIQDWKSGATEAQQWTLFTDPDNHQSLCSSCHNRKTGRTNK